MKNKIFNQIKVRKPGRNAFDLSHEKKLSLNMGDLVPIYLQEVVPGDKFRVNTEMLMRMAPMVAPVMHRVNVYTHFFFVPNRIIYKEWETFITGGKDGKQIPAFPKVTITNTNKTAFKSGSLADYLGLPTAPQVAPVDQTLAVSALPFRAYQKIYNEYYRDETLSAEIAVTDESTVQPAEEAAIVAIQRRAWEKDYFTSALPTPQRGDDVLIPMDIEYSRPARAYVEGRNPDPANELSLTAGGVSTPGISLSGTGTDNDSLVSIENIDGLRATINDLRKATRLQEWLEKNARGGYRYIEQMWSHFHVKSSDARLQRPEYLGGGKSPIVISEVLSTFNNTETPGGTMYGHGISAGVTHQFKRFFEEHGYVIGIMSVLPRTCYQQGVPRTFFKFDKFDYYWPEFAQLGEQEVFNKEVFMPYEGTSYAPDGTFGYQSRYAEYKFNNSSVHGDFRESLSFWHMGRILQAGPNLNEAFIKSDPTHRVFAVTDETVHKLYCQIYNNVQAIRPMPVFGVPTL